MIEAFEVLTARDRALRLATEAAREPTLSEVAESPQERASRLARSRTAGSVGQDYLDISFTSIKILDRLVRVQLEDLDRGPSAKRILDQRRIATIDLTMPNAAARLSALYDRSWRFANVFDLDASLWGLQNLWVRYPMQRCRGCLMLWGLLIGAGAMRPTWKHLLTKTVHVVSARTLWAQMPQLRPGGRAQSSARSCVQVFRPLVDDESRVGL